MCCFTGPVHHVSATNIFARARPDGRQFIAYGMTVGFAHDVAMVLPIPTPIGAPEDVVTFVDMSACPKFFDALDGLFPKLAIAGFGSVPRPAPIAHRLLAVHDVGDFEASFVPRTADFSRLDRRFQLSEETWRALPEYGDWGFAVFKLRRVADRQRVHPMGFEFPRRSVDTIFFPTVHVHDGRVRERATFDHTLYYQTEPSWTPLITAERGARPTSMLAAEAHAFVDLDGPILRETHHGDLPNDDIWIRGELLRGRHFLGESFRVRINASWDILAGKGRGRPRGAAEVQPHVWRELSTPESERLRARDIAGAVFTRAIAARGAAWGVVPIRYDLPEVHPTPGGPFGAPAATAQACTATFFEYATRVAGIGVTIAFAAPLAGSTVSEIRATLRDAVLQVNAA